MNLKFYLPIVSFCLSVGLAWCPVSTTAIIWYRVCAGLRVKINAYLSRQFSSKRLPSWIVPRNCVSCLKYSSVSGLLSFQVMQCRYLISIFLKFKMSYMIFCVPYCQNIYVETLHLLIEVHTRFWNLQCRVWGHWTQGTERNTMLQSTKTV